MIVTENASHDDLSEQEYREIFDELREQLSLTQFVGYIRCEYSRALWSKYERCLCDLNRTQRNELRRAGGLSILVEVSGIDDERNDDEVAVSLYYSLDPMRRDGTSKSILPDFTFRISESEEYTQSFARFRGRIVVYRRDVRTGLCAAFVGS